MCWTLLRVRTLRIADELEAVPTKGLLLALFILVGMTSQSMEWNSYHYWILLILFINWIDLTGKPGWLPVLLMWKSFSARNACVWSARSILLASLKAGGWRAAGGAQVSYSPGVKTPWFSSSISMENPWKGGECFTWGNAAGGRLGLGSCLTDGAGLLSRGVRGRFCGYRE